MTKFIAACVACFFTANATATILRIDSENLLSPESYPQWNYPSPLPVNVSVSFWLDTLSADASLFETFQGSNDTCLGRFDTIGLNVSNFVVKADGLDLWTADSLNFGIKGVNATGRCPGNFFGSFSTADSGRSLTAAWDFSGISQSDLFAGNDPMANILLNIGSLSGVMFLAGEWGSISPTTMSSSIREVPEPSTLVLMSVGLFALSYLSLSRRRSSKPRDAIPY